MPGSSRSPAVLIATLSLSAFVLSACPSDSNTDAATDGTDTNPDDTGATEDTDTGGQTGMCLSIDECPDTHWCDFPDDLCGAGITGECVPRPENCSDNEVSVCGCNGEVYVEDCEAVSGYDKNADASACTPPAGMFACGGLLCDAGSFYCQIQVSDVVGEPDGFACLPLPGGCAPADCACLAGENCGDMCEMTGEGLTLTCPGG